MSDTTKPDKGTGIDWSEEEEWPWQADELPDDDFEVIRVFSLPFLVSVMGMAVPFPPFQHIKPRR